MIDAGTGLEKGNFPTTIRIEVQAVVSPDQDQEQVQKEIEYDVISVGNMIISQSKAHF